MRLLNQHYDHRTAFACPQLAHDQTTVMRLLNQHYDHLTAFACPQLAHDQTTHAGGVCSVHA